MIFSLNTFINLKSSVILFILIFVIGFSDRYFNFYKPKMNGHSSFTMKSVVQQYRKLIERNQDLGSSFAIYNGSLRILDLIGGYEDLEFQEVWNKNTISQLFSVSNIISVLTIGHLLDRGKVSYEDKISKYLPYCHDSIANITISDILAHKANIPYFKKSRSITDYRDEPIILFQQVLSQPATVSNARIFHKYTMGLIIDAIVRSIDPSNRTVADYFNQEIRIPNKLDILIGLPRTQNYRAARIYNPTFRHFVYALGRFDIGAMLDYWIGDSDIANKVESTFSDMKGTRTKNPEYLEIPLPSWNAFSNADSLAKLFSIIFFGTHESPPLFKQSTVLQLCATNDRYYDEILGTYVSFTNGGLMSFSGPKNSIFHGWRDSTGQFLVVDLNRNITIAYVTNHLRALTIDKDYIYTSLLGAIYDYSY